MKDENYQNVHRWVEKRLGKPKKCELCGSCNEERYDWSNKDHKYLYAITDWQRLCQKCHRIYDMENNKISIVCTICGIVFKAQGKNTKCCSEKCARKRRKYKEHLFFIQT